MKMNIYEALNILRLPPNPTEDEIKQAYRKRIVLCHPDKGPVSERDERHRRTQEMNAAKAILLEQAESRKTEWDRDTENEKPSGRSSSKGKTSQGFVRPNFSSQFRAHQSNSRKPDPFFRSKQGGGRSTYRPPTKAESRAGAAALNRSKSRRGFGNGKKRMKAGDLLKAWKKQKTSHAAASGSRNGEESTPSKEMDAQNRAYEKLKEEQRLKVEKRLQEAKKKKEEERAWAWGWNSKVSALQRQISKGEPGAVDITECAKLERELRGMPFHQTLLLTLPTLEFSLNWLKHQHNCSRLWVERAARKQFMNTLDLKSRILEVRSFLRETADFAVPKQVYVEIDSILFAEREKYKVHLKQLAQRRAKREKKRALKRARKEAEAAAGSKGAGKVATGSSGRTKKRHSKSSKKESNAAAVGEEFEDTQVPLPEPQLADLLDIEMEEEGWQVRDNTFFVIPMAASKLSWKIENISMFRELTTVKIWRNHYFKTFAETRRSVMEKLSEKEKERRAQHVPNSLNEEERFLREVEEADFVPKEGDLVEVMRRKWAGVNDEGGLAKVTKISSDQTVDIKYVMDNRRVKNVDMKYVKKYKEDEEEGTGRAGRGRRERAKKQKILITREELIERIDNFLNVLDARQSEQRNVHCNVAAEAESLAPKKIAGAEPTEEPLSPRAKMVCLICAVGEACKDVFKREGITVVNCSQVDVAFKRLEQLEKDMNEVFNEVFNPSLFVMGESKEGLGEEAPAAVSEERAHGATAPESVAKNTHSDLSGPEEHVPRESYAPETPEVPVAPQGPQEVAASTSNSETAAMPGEEQSGFPESHNLTEKLRENTAEPIDFKLPVAASKATSAQKNNIDTADIREPDFVPEAVLQPSRVQHGYKGPHLYRGATPAGPEVSTPQQSAPAAAQGSTSGNDSGSQPTISSFFSKVSSFFSP